MKQLLSTVLKKNNFYLTKFNKFTVFFIFSFLISTCVYGMDFKPYYSGIRLDANMNAYNSAAMGIGVESMYSIFPEWNVGYSVDYSTEFCNFNTLEILLKAQYLFPWKVFGVVPFGVGLDVGYEQIWHNELATMIPSVGAELRLFYTPFKNNKFTLSPFCKIAYPYLWAIGISFGVLFI